MLHRRATNLSPHCYLCRVLKRHIVPTTKCGIFHLLYSSCERLKHVIIYQLLNELDHDARTTYTKDLVVAHVGYESYCDRVQYIRYEKTSLTPALLDRMVNVTPCFISLRYDRGNSQNTKCGIWSGTNFVDLPNFRGMNTSDSYPYIQLDINIFTAHLGNPTEPIVDIKQFILN